MSKRVSWLLLVSCVCCLACYNDVLFHRKLHIKRSNQSSPWRGVGGGGGGVKTDSSNTALTMSE